MSRISAALKNIVARKSYIAYELVHLDIDGGVYMTNAQNPIVSGGNTYLPFGGFLGFSHIEETAEFQVSKLTLTLTGIPMFDQDGDSFIAQFLQHTYIDKEVKIYRVFVDKSDTVLDDPVLIFHGYMDKPSIDDDPQGSTTVGVEISNHWVDFNRIAGRHTNNDEQRVLYPTDGIFKASHETNKDIKWAPAE